MEKTSILMVCMGNICRSPTAEAVMRTLTERAGLAGMIAKIDSAGTHGYHVGEAPDPRAIRIGAKRGYDLSRLRARQVSVQDFSRFDHVLAMDGANLSALRRQCPEGLEHKVSLLMRYAPALETDEVPDPYYGGDAGFERVLDLIEAATQGFIDTVLKPR